MTSQPKRLQSLVIKWAKATEAFQYRYAKLDKAINSLQSPRSRETDINRNRLRRLLELRQHSTDVLMTLLLDMSGQKLDRSMQPIKPGQLHSHTRLLDELNQTIDDKLVLISQEAPANTSQTVSIESYSGTSKVVERDENIFNFNKYVDSVVTAYGLKYSEENPLKNILFNSYYEEYGQYIFKDFSSYKDWLLLANPDLDGRSPHDYVTDTNDLTKIKDVLGRIAHGVYF